MDADREEPMHHKCRQLLAMAVVVFALFLYDTIDVSASSHSWVQGTQEYNSLYENGMDGMIGSTTSDIQIETGNAERDAVVQKLLHNVALTEDEEQIMATWMEEDFSSYTETMLAISLATIDGDVGWVESAISGLFASVGKGAYRLFNRGAYPFTINNMLFGRMCDDNYIGINLVAFELTTYNPYGIVGAYLYRFFRSIAYGLFLWMFLAEIVRQVYSNDKKSRAEFKNTCQMILFLMIVMYLFPKVADLTIYLKDAFVKMIYDQFSNLSNLGNDIVATFKEQYEEEKSLLNAFLFDAAVFSVVPYAISYIKIALMELLLFCLGPGIFILSIKNHKLLSTWGMTFFSNIFISVIDMIMVLLPVLMNTIKRVIVYSVPGITSNSIGLVFVIIELTCLFAVVPLRSALLRMIGNATGVQMGGSLGGIGVIAMMAARTMRGMKRGGDMETGRKRGGNTGNYETDSSMADHIGAVNDNFFENRQNGFRDLPDFNLDNDTNSGFATAQSFAASATDTNGYSTRDNADVPAGTGSVIGVDNSAATAFDESNIMSQESVADLSGKGPIDLSDVETDIGSFESDISQIPASTDNFEETVTGIGTSRDQVQSMEPVLNDQDMSASAILADQNVDSAIMGSSNGAFINYSGNESISERRQQNLEKMDQYSGEMASIADENMRLQKNISETAEHRNEVNRLLASGYESDNITPLTQERRSELDHLSHSLSAVEDKNKEEIASNNSKMAVLRDSYNSAVRNEKSFAEMYAQAGLSKQTFTTASAFKRQNRIDNAKRELATYKNFDSRQFEGILTPAERERYYRQRVTHDARISAAKAGMSVVYGTAVATTAFVGAAAGAHGGLSSTMTGAYVGANIPGMAVGLGKTIGRKSVNAAHVVSNLRTSAYPQHSASGVGNYANISHQSVRSIDRDHIIDSPHNQSMKPTSSQPEIKTQQKKTVVDRFDERAEKGEKLDLSKYLNGENE